MQKSYFINAFALTLFNNINISNRYYFKIIILLFFVNPFSTAFASHPLESEILYNFQVDEYGNHTPLIDNEFDRKNNPWLGTKIYIDGWYYPPKDGSTKIKESAPEPGDKFEIRWKNNTDKLVMDSLLLEYLSVDINTACWRYTYKSDGVSAELCSKTYANYVWNIYPRWVQCLPEGIYQVELY